MASGREGRGGAPREFYTGRELEADALGVPKFPKAYQETFRRLAAEKGYLSYNRAQELIREFYPEDPTNPSKEFAKDLRLHICEDLGLENEEDANDVRFYSAVGTPLDHFHGVDAWIEMDLDHPTAGMLHVQVTLDATKNTRKMNEGHKADIIFGDVPAPDEKNYLETVEKYGTEASDILFSRLKSAVERRMGVMAAK